MIDPWLETIKVFRRQATFYVLSAELALERGEILTTPLLPGLDLPLAKIFED